jgi:hypothetical protein
VSPAVIAAEALPWAGTTEVAAAAVDAAAAPAAAAAAGSPALAPTRLWSPAANLMWTATSAQLAARPDESLAFFSAAMRVGCPVLATELPLEVDWGGMLEPEMLGTPGEGMTISGTGTGTGTTGTGTGTGTGAGNEGGEVLLPPPPPPPGASIPAPLPVPLTTFRDAYRRGKSSLQQQQQQCPPMTTAAARWESSEKFPRLAADLLGSLPFAAVTHPRGGGLVQVEFS